MVCVSDQREQSHYNMIKFASSPGGRLEVMDDAKDRVINGGTTPSSSYIRILNHLDRKSIGGLACSS